MGKLNLYCYGKDSSFCQKLGLTLDPEINLQWELH